MRSLPLAACLAALSMPAFGQSQQCAPRDVVLDGLASRYQEAPVMHGATSQGHVVEVLLSDDGATWTVLVTMPSGIACMAAEGQAWTMRPFAPAAVPDSPA